MPETTGLKTSCSELSRPGHDVALSCYISELCTVTKHISSRKAFLLYCANDELRIRKVDFPKPVDPEGLRTTSVTQNSDYTP